MHGLKASATFTPRFQNINPESEFEVSQKRLFVIFSIL